MELWLVSDRHHGHWAVLEGRPDRARRQHTPSLRIGFKVAGTTTVQFGEGQWTVGVPAPGAVAMLALGAFGRRRRR